MKRYETVTIIDPDLSGDQREPVIERISGLITQQDGMMVFKDEWGSRKLAYDIKTKSRGYYIRFDYCGTGSIVNEIERFCRIDDRVLKYMTVLTDKYVDIEKVQKEIADTLSKIESTDQAIPDETPIVSEPPALSNTESTDQAIPDETPIVSEPPAVSNTESTDQNIPDETPVVSEPPALSNTESTDQNIPDETPVVSEPPALSNTELIDQNSPDEKSIVSKTLSQAPENVSDEAVISEPSNEDEEQSNEQ